ncbi:hypothetical protein Gotri_025880 [Gossypium trilobum]|uniref:DUF7745 domain-containing protein n=1 Tax=Gossypium trilobum TaxID=34281 RepID=A0A7J9FVU9_9ROSI|nr:hypothetical protein [Gossypium trilobum]
MAKITGKSEQWITARIKQKGECKCIAWKNLRDLILAHLNTKKKLDRGVTPVPAILAETFRSLNRVFSENYSPLKEIVATPRRDDILEEKWIALLQNLQEEDVEWKAPWLIPDRILYQCGRFDWVPLLGIWGATGYAPLLTPRQYGSR